MTEKRTRTDYKKAYTMANYDRIEITVPKGQKVTIQSAAKDAGESMNMFIQRAILQRMGIDAWPEE